MAGNTTEFNNGLPSPYPSEDNRVENSAQEQPVTQSTAYPNYGRPLYAAVHQQPGATMASHSSSLDLQDGAEVAHPDSQEDAQQLKSDPDVPIDPNIASAQSPTQYAYAHGQPSMYAADHGQHGYPQAMPYHQGQPRPDWAAGYGHSGHATPITPNHHVGFHHQQTTPTQRQGNQVFSFVPIPGSQQHKRPRRRYEEIERMYKCGWNGCEKAYGTLNHLNAHVTMQSHGVKRVPEEFKEIRKEWKAKKKAEEATRKQADDQARNDGHGGSADAQEAQRGYAPATRNLPAPQQMNYGGFSTAPEYAGENNSSFQGYMAATAPTQYSPTYAHSHNAVYGQHGQQSNGGQAH